MKWQQKTALLLCALALGSSTLLASTVEAKKPNKVKPENKPEKSSVTTIPTTTPENKPENKPEKNSVTTIPTTTSTSMHLPPGIQKNLARGKKLPPGLAKKGLRSATVDN